MKRRRRSKIRKKIIFGIILIFIILIILSPFIFVNIKLIGNKMIELDYGEKYSEPGFKAYMFNKDITDKVKVDNKVKDDIGDYEITYSYKLWIYNIKRTRKVVVSDLTGPEIILEGDRDLSVTIDTKYEEPGYEAIDKLDGDLTKSVKVTDNIDITKLGNYEVIYEVKDSTGNLSREIRNIKVERLKPTQMSVEEYTLDGWYDSVKLKETKNYGNEYFNSITLAGDSNTMNMYLNGILSGLRAWAIPCLHAESMHSIDINLYGLGIKMKLINAVEKYKPETLILNFGTFSTNWISEETFINNANSMIEQIKEKSPDTKIILILFILLRKVIILMNFNKVLLINIIF